MKNKRKLQNVKLNFKKDDNMKNKKTIIIVIIILLLVLVGVTTALVLKPKKASTTNNNYKSIEKKLSSTKEIKGNVATNKIILETTSNIDTTKKSTFMDILRSNWFRRIFYNKGRKHLFNWKY